MAPVLPENFGKYVLKERLAVGGMAEIFLGFLEGDRGFSKQVVIKRILPHFSSDQDFVSMFIDEACIAARLNHVNIVQVYDFGSVGGAYYIAMEYIDGLDLRTLLREFELRGRSLSAAEVAAIGEAVARGLHHAHVITDEGGTPLDLVHRDVSPHNIMVSRNGDAKITDFGIAKARDRATHTQTGAIKGKVAYMAPEQAVGGRVDGRTDQFALGIVLWECLAAQRLFVGSNNLSILHKVSECQIPSLSQVAPGVSPELSRIVQQMLSRNPEERFSSLEEVSKLLGAFRFSMGTEGVVHLDELVEGIAPVEVIPPPKEHSTSGTLPLAAEEKGTSKETAASHDPWAVSLQSQTATKESEELGKDELTSLLKDRTKTIQNGDDETLLAMAAASSKTANRGYGWLGVAFLVLCLVVAATIEWRSPPSAEKSEPGLPQPEIKKVSVSVPKVEEPEKNREDPAEIKPLKRAPLKKTSPKLVPRKPRDVAPKKRVAEGKKPVLVGSGRLYLRTTQAWATVFLEGKKLGTTPLANVKMPAGKHELLLINTEAGYQRRIELVVKNGQVIKKTIRFP